MPAELRRKTQATWHHLHANAGNAFGLFLGSLIFWVGWFDGLPEWYLGAGTLDSAQELSL